MHWIKVSEKLPKLNQDVFYYFEIVGVHQGKYLGECEIGSVFGGDTGFLSGDVTHWQPYEGQERPLRPRRRCKDDRV